MHQHRDQQHGKRDEGQQRETYENVHPAFDLCIGKIGQERPEAVLRQVLDRNPAGKRFAQLLGMIDRPSANCRLGQHPLPIWLMIEAQIRHDGGPPWLRKLGRAHHDPVDIGYLEQQIDLARRHHPETGRYIVLNDKAQHIADREPQHETRSQMETTIIKAQQEHAQHHRAIGRRVGRQYVSECTGSGEGSHAPEEIEPPKRTNRRADDAVGQWATGTLGQRELGEAHQSREQYGHRQGHESLSAQRVEPGGAGCLDLALAKHKHMIPQPTLFAHSTQDGRNRPRVATPICAAIRIPFRNSVSAPTVQGSPSRALRGIHPAIESDNPGRRS